MEPPNQFCGKSTVRVEHWNANTAYYRESDCSGLTDSMTRAYGRLIAGAGAFETPAPLRHRDDPWRLHVLAHENGPRVLQARIVAPDEQPVAVLAVAEGGGDGPRRAWRETVAAVPWMSAERGPSDFRDHLPDRPWVIMGLLPALAVHGEAVEWLGDVEQCIAWAFLKSLQPMTSA